jgi:acetyl esterase/lipase
MRTLLGVLIGVMVLASPVWAGLPDGSPRGPLAPECWPDQALQALRADVPLAKKIKVVQSWIDHCEFHWQSPSNSQLLMLAHYAKFKYPFSQPYVKKAQIPLHDGRKLRAVMAFKPADKARDLVIFRCGVFCDSDSSSTLSNALMNVFEENPVHLVFLNSTSGLEYAKDNGAAHMGGFDEGYQNLEVAKYILKRQGQLGIKVRRIHIMGMSLGGLSTLFSSLYAETAEEFQGMNFGSFVAVCPMVDTRSEFDEHLGYRNFASLVFKYRTRKLFKGLPILLKPLEKILTGKNMASAQERDNITTALDLSAHYYEENWNRLGFAGYIPRPRGMDRVSLLDASNVLYYENRYSPNTVVLHAKNDILVPWEKNSRKLVGRQTDRLGVLSTKRGNHCAFTEAMDWGFFSQFVSGLVNGGKDLPRTKIAVPAAVAAAYSQRLWPGDAYSHYQWSVKPGAREARLTLWRFSDRGNGCAYQKPHYSPMENMYACQTSSTVKVPLTDLRGFGVPAAAGDVSAANRLERYLNGRTRLVLRNGQRAVSTTESPVSFESQGKFDPRYGLL